ncbi:fibronectin type III-like domain-contianing protein [Algibacter sp.]
MNFTISVEDLKFYNSNLDFIAEPGDFQVFVGTNSEINLKVQFELTN